MSDNKTSHKVKQLADGGWAIYSIDPKDKKEIQTSYIGPNLKMEAFLPENSQILK